MQQDGFRLSAGGYTSLIVALGKFDELEKAFEVFEDMVKQGIDPDVVTYGALIHAHCRHLKLNEALHVFDHMQYNGVTANEIIYTSMIQAHLRGGFVAGGLKLWKAMKGQGIQVDKNTANKLINTCIVCHEHDVALEIVRDMQSHGLDPNRDLSKGLKATL